MKKNASIPAILFVFLVFFIFYPWCSIALADNQYPIKKVINGIGAIQKYQVKLDTKIFPPNASDIGPNAPGQFDPNRFMEVKSVVFGEAGKKMKLLTTMNSAEFGAGMEHTLIFDGTWLWVQQKMNMNPQMKTNQPMISAMKIHISSVSPDPVNEPFNTIYGVSGTGLFRYRDLPGTFMELIKDYSFKSGKKSSDSKEIIFSGIKKAIKNKSKTRKAEKELAEYMDKSTSFCKVWVSENNNRIVAYSIGKSEKRPTMKTEIEYISVNKELPDNIFSYVPPDGVVVRDATANILRQKVKNQ